MWEWQDYNFNKKIRKDKYSLILILLIEYLLLLKYKQSLLIKIWLIKIYLNNETFGFAIKLIFFDVTAISKIFMLNSQVMIVVLMFK